MLMFLFILMQIKLIFTRKVKHRLETEIFWKSEMAPSLNLEHSTFNNLLHTLLKNT